MDRGSRLRFSKVATQNRAPTESRRTVEAARRPQFVLTACRASGEDKTLRSTACRHQDSQESSGDDKMAPYRVRARAPPHRTSTVHASGPLGDLHATNAPHTPLFNLPHFSRALAREQCARATAEAAPSRPKAASPAPSLKPSAAHGQIGRSSAEFARGGSSDQPRPQWAFGSDESTHQLSSIAQVHAMAAGCFHRLSAQPHRDAPPRAQSFPRP